MLDVHQHEVMNAQLPAEPICVFQSAQSMHVQSNKTAKINSKPLNAPRIQVPKSKCKSCIFETTSEFDLLQHQKYYCRKNYTAQDQIRHAQNTKCDLNQETKGGEHDVLEDIDEEDIDTYIQDKLEEKLKAKRQHANVKPTSSKPNKSMVSQGQSDVSLSADKSKKMDLIETGTFNCGQCPYETLSKSGIVSHRLKVHGSKSTTLECNLPSNLSQLMPSRNQHKKINESDIPLKVMYKRIKVYKMLIPA